MGIRTFDEHSDLQRIRDMIHDGKVDDIQALLFPYRDADIGDLLPDIERAMEKECDYETPRDWFQPVEHKTYMDYFKRKLSDSKEREIDAKAGDFAMVLPVECNVEAVDKLDRSDRIVRIKERPVKLAEDLLKFGIDASDFVYLDLKLLRCFYHRVHSPVTGTIKKSTFVGRHEPIFGANSLWIVEIDSDIGPVYVLIVGELQIQDFEFKKKSGKIMAAEEIGNFSWGSQVVVLFDRTALGRQLVVPGKRYFIGDGAFSYGGEKNKSGYAD